MKHSMKTCPPQRSARSQPTGKNRQKPELVYERSTVAPGSTSDYPEIGYNYTVSFDITGAKKVKEPNCSVRLTPYSICQTLFGDDGICTRRLSEYLPLQSESGRKATIQIEGDNCSTTLRVNGKVVDEMNTQKLYFNAGKDSMNYVRTLVSRWRKQETLIVRYRI